MNYRKDFIIIAIALVLAVISIFVSYNTRKKEAINTDKYLIIEKELFCDYIMTTFKTGYLLGAKNSIIAKDSIFSDSLYVTDTAWYKIRVNNVINCSK